jgi:pimeloyl-ACP methyl ester carboxylesterase
MKKVKTLAAAAMLSATATIAQADTFVIVHGAFQSAESWAGVTEKLRAKGHTAIIVDLPGRNFEGEAAKAITLAQYAKTVGDVVASQAEPVILVGHSFGGMTISLVAEAMPEKIRKLIYVAAYVPVSGDSMQSLAASDKNNGFTADSFVLSPDYAFATILAADQTRLFINDGTPEQQAHVTSSMMREPLGPIGTPVDVTALKFGSVAKAYVNTALDATVSPTLQKMMIDRAGIMQTQTLQTGHSPQASQPEQLAAALVALAK